MQFSIASVLSLLVGSAAALPAAATNSSTIPEGAKFQILSLRSASPVHFTYFQAAHRSLLLHLPDQGAQCTGGDKISNNLAVFYLQDGGLYLYGGEDNQEPQQLFVDLSGMGQGVLQYTTGKDAGIPRNAQRGPWTIDENDFIRVAGYGFLACPNSIDGAWSIWAGESSSPGGNKDCLGITARAVVNSSPGSCKYSTE